MLRSWGILNIEASSISSLCVDGNAVETVELFGIVLKTPNYDSFASSFIVGEKILLAAKANSIINQVTAGNIR